jgi:hypothetical protein
MESALLEDLTRQGGPGYGEAETAKRCGTGAAGPTLPSGGREMYSSSTALIGEGGVALRLREAE